MTEDVALPVRQSFLEHLVTAEAITPESRLSASLFDDIGASEFCPDSDFLTVSSLASNNPPCVMTRISMKTQLRSRGLAGAPHS